MRTKLGIFDVARPGVPIWRWQGNAPDIFRLIEGDAKMERLRTICENYARACRLPRKMDVKDDAVAQVELLRGFSKAPCMLTTTVSPSHSKPVA